MTAPTTEAQALRSVTPDMLAAAWTVVRGRYPEGRVLGVGPGFAEAIAAALAVSPLLSRDAAARAEIDRLRAAIAVKDDALRPFAEYARLSEEAGLNIGPGEIGEFIHAGLRRSIHTRDLEAARSALAPEPQEGEAHGLR